MKNSTEYSKKVHKLYRLLKRKYPKVKKTVYDEPVDALVYALISENMSEAESQSAMKRFAGHFIDVNDLRVSRIEEIIEVLDDDTPAARNAALAVTRALRSVFDKHHSVSLKGMRKIGKRPAKQSLEKMEGISHFAVNYCMLTSLQGHAIPLTKKMIEYLRSNELVNPDADEQQIEGFLVRQISSKNAYEFYALLRRRSEQKRTETKRKTTAKRKKSAKTRTKKQTKK